MLKKFLVLFSFYFISATSFSSFNCNDVEELDFQGDKIVFSNKKGVFLLKRCEKKLEKIFSFKTKQILAPKVAVFNQNVFFTTQDAKFFCIDLNGNVIFENELASSSRSNVLVDDENLFFSLVNQYIVCYSKDGKIIWLNRDFYTSDREIKSKLLFDNNYLYFFHKDTFSVLDKRTGKKVFSINKFKNAFDFYLYDANSKAMFLSDENLKILDIRTNKVDILDKDLNYNKIISRNYEYVYEKGFLKNIKTGEKIFINIDCFYYFDEKVFAFSDNCLLVIDGNSVSIEKINFKIKKLIYKNGMLVLVTSDKILWKKL